jgi:hypothetical protein
MATIVRYTFSSEVDLEEVGGTLALAVMAVESLFGEAEVALEARYEMRPRKRQCEIDCSTEVGRDLNRVFVGYLRREFGDCAFAVARVRPATAAA